MYSPELWQDWNSLHRGTKRQKLMDHPHVHCVVPAGAISDDGVEWIPAHKGFLFPVDTVKSVYRGKFMSFFKDAITHGTLQFHGSLQEIISKYQQFINTHYNTEWVVYLKESFASPAAVIKYLGAYTNRIAISNSRIKCIVDGKVTFSYRDRKNGNVEKLLTLPVNLFVQRFLLHVIPSGFVRIRYYGFMSNRNRTERILECQVAITADITVNNRVEKVLLESEGIISEVQT